MSFKMSNLLTFVVVVAIFLALVYIFTLRKNDNGQWMSPFATKSGYVTSLN